MLAVAAFLSLFGVPQDRVTALRGVRSWMYQLQGLEDPASRAALAASHYDLLVLDPDGFGRHGKPCVKFLHQKHKLVLAYIDIGQAEDYRSYWMPSWRPPTKGGNGWPDFIIAPDPDGWNGNFNVAYWDHRWQSIWLGNRGIVQRLADDGFDGVYLDWVGAFDDAVVVSRAEKEGVSPGRTMLKFIRLIKQTGGK